MILQLSSDDSEGVVDEVVVDVHLGESVRSPGRDPLLVGVVVDHHRRPGRSYALFWPFVSAKNSTRLGLLLYLSYFFSTTDLYW